MNNTSPPSAFGLYPSEMKQETNIHYTSPYPYYASYPFMQYKQQVTTVVSPPLTPALTPMLMDSNSDPGSSTSRHPDYYAHSTFTHHNGSSDSSVTSSPLTHTQHKHVCHFHFCGWSFKRYEHLKRHMLVHTGERPYSCHFPGCGKSFSRSDNFHAHYRTHTKKKLSKKRTTAIKTTSVTMDKNCHNRNSAFSSLVSSTATKSICNASNVAANAAAAVAVSQQLEPNNNNIGVYYHTQSMMNDFYSTTFQNISPISSPTPTTTTTTTSTNATATTNSSTSTTTAPTNTIKSHMCPIIQCQGRFKRLEHLKRHMRIHTLERPFNCTFPGCQKSFSRSDNLSQHVKTHSKSSDKRRRR